jgi:hypothetical protein
VSVVLADAGVSAGDGADGAAEEEADGIEAEGGVAEIYTRDMTEI